MALSESYKKATDSSNEKLFRDVNLRVAAVLLRAQTEGQIDGFSSENRSGADGTLRHNTFRVNGRRFQERRAQARKPIESDFSIALQAGKSGPVSMEFSPGHTGARNFLSRITEGRLGEIKGPHDIAHVTEPHFKLMQDIIARILSKSARYFQERRPRNTPRPHNRPNAGQP